MAGDWQGFALEKAELLSSRLKDLLSSGQGYVRAQFGMDLGLKPELYPTWFILATAAVGLLLLLGLSWATVCGLLAGKKRGSPVLQSGTEPGRAQFARAAKPEEPKKRNRKKTLEKAKTQSNGQPVSVGQEQVKAPEVVSKPKPSPPVKTEKAPEVQTAPAQVKKEKKKAKANAKPVQHAAAAASEGKEPDDGAWQTKVSNREKRQQRRKEKGPEGSGSPGGAETAKAHAGSSAAPLPANGKKSRGSHDVPHSRAAAKGEAPRGSASAGRREEPSVDAGWTDFSLKMPGQMGAMEASKWGAIPATARYRAQPEQQPWTQETQAWIKTELGPGPFTMLGLNTTDSISKSMELQSAWESRTGVDDEWSGINGVASVDSSSDWNAPVEHWGNYEEPPATAAPAPPLKEQPLPSKASEDEKDAEDPTGAAAKSKKRRKKKKKSEEESAAEAQVGNTIPKPQEPPASAPKKQNPSISSSHKKSEPSAEPPKPSQKKKSRRET